MKKCSATGCEKNSVVKGWCKAHYMRWRKYGDANWRRQSTVWVIDPDGYRRGSVNGIGPTLEHIFIAISVLGKPLPKGAVVHHVNGNPADNRKENLVICPSQAYHNLLHRRQRAFEQSGNANFMRCSYCKTYSDPASLDGKGGKYHKRCAAEYMRVKTSRKEELTISTQGA